MTADGRWFLCLYARQGLELGAALRAGASSDELREMIAGRWSVRDDRGAMLRLAEHERSALAPIDELRRDPHLEMHTRGG